jgi:hypothetical protein
MRLCFLSLAGAAILFAESIAGLQWTAPPGWKNEGTAPMRAATYRIPPAPGDKDPAECVVYFFGQGQGGPVDANIERWKDQFHTANGKIADAKVAKHTIHGLPVTTIDTSGAYSGMGGPLASGPPVPGYRLLGAIIENPGGNIFLKFTGPTKTVAQNQSRFEQFLQSFQRAAR